MSPAFDGSPISAIEIASANPRVIFVGTTRGGIFRTRDGGVTWSENLASSDVPARTITSIQVHPRSVRTVVATVASTGTAGSGVALSSGKDLPYRHVFRSEDEGDYWEDIDNGWFPNLALYAAAYETHPPYRLFVAGDVGVGLEKDGVWLNISGNLPNVVVSDLVYHHKDRTLTAATYGRGIWRLPCGKLRFEGVVNRPMERIRLAAGLRVDPSIPIPVQLTPANGAVFDVFPRITQATVKPVYGALGYQVEVFTESLGSSFAASSTTPEITFAFVGKGKGKWRAWAILPDGLRSNASKWRSFTYLR